LPIVGAKPFEKAGGIVYSQVPMVKKELVFKDRERFFPVGNS
jgi:hypothetical protein